MLCVAYGLRPDSEGKLAITASNPDAALDIEPNYFATEHDRNIAVGVFRRVRQVFASRALAQHIQCETAPGEQIQSDRDILDAALSTGTAGYHTVGTCAMGPRADDVVDARLRVRGVTNLRIVDASVLPIVCSRHEADYLRDESVTRVTIIPW